MARIVLKHLSVLFALSAFTITIAIAQTSADQIEAALKHAPKIKMRGQKVRLRQIGVVTINQDTSGLGRIALPITFEFNSALLTPPARKELDHLANALNRPSIAKANIKIIGHTDAKGSDDYNLDLSERRANAVLAYLVSQHSQLATRFQLEGRGETQLALPKSPLSPDNRRVEFVNLGLM